MSRDEDTDIYSAEIEEENDIYSAEDLSDEDGVSTEESAFMRGYKEAGKQEEDEE